MGEKKIPKQQATVVSLHTLFSFLKGQGRFFFVDIEWLTEFHMYKLIHWIQWDSATIKMIVILIVAVIDKGWD